MKNFALLGKNISYSLSPKIHKEILKILNLNSSYKLLDYSEDKLSSLITELKNDTKLDGLNITIPYKTTIFQFLDEISKEAKTIGAVNCIKIEKNKILGYNTDFFGLIKTFKYMKLNLKNKKVYILGSGGASLACVSAVKSLNGIPFVVSRTPIFNNSISYNELKSCKGYLLINATPIGTSPNINSSPVSEEIISNFDSILDLTYNPNETLFLKYAKTLKKNYCNGLPMLIFQAIKSQEIWNNLNLSEDIYSNIYTKIIKNLYTKEEFL